MVLLIYYKHILSSFWPLEQLRTIPTIQWKFTSFFTCVTLLLVDELDVCSYKKAIIKCYLGLVCQLIKKVYWIHIVFLTVSKMWAVIHPPPPHTHLYTAIPLRCVYTEYCFPLGLIGSVDWFCPCVVRSVQARQPLYFIGTKWQTEDWKVLI